MIKQLQTLIVEDHPFIVEGYLQVLEQITLKDSKLNFNITVAKDCEEAKIEIEHAIRHYIIDFIILDISLPPSHDKTLLSGDDLGIKLRSLFPEIKILISTHLSNNYRLINILKTVKPDGLLLKKELTFKSLTAGVLNVTSGIPFYSNPILKLVRQHISNDFNLDDIDRKILYHLSQGSKTKELTTVVNLSQSGVENRKRRLNQIFNNDTKKDKVLLNLAKANGFL